MKFSIVQVLSTLFCVASQCLAGVTNRQGNLQLGPSYGDDHVHPTHGQENPPRQPSTQAQELPFGLHPNDSPLAKLISVQDLLPKLDSQAIRKVYRYGPYVVPGAKQPSVGQITDKAADSLGSLVFNERLSDFCGGECIVLKGSGFPVYENGTSVAALSQSIYNHHVFGINVDDPQRKHVCPGSTVPATKIATTFIGGGTDREFYQYNAASSSSLKAGYEVKKGDRIDLQTELMNYRDEPQTVNILVDVEYLPGKHDGYLSSKTIEFVASPCEYEFFFNLSQKKYTTTSKEWDAPSDGYIMGIRGHEHDGGSGVYVRVNGKLVCASIPTYKSSSNGLRVAEFSSCDDIVPLKKGDKVTMQADYYIEKYPQRVSNSGVPERVAALVMITLAFPSGFRLD